MLTPRQKGIMVLFILMVPIGLVLLWFFVINRGTVEVIADAPYTMKILQTGKAKECLFEGCKVSLIPHAYTVSVEKKGYFTKKKEIIIERWKTTSVKMILEFMPTLTEKANLKIPELSEENVSHNLNEVTLLAPAFSKNFQQSLKQEIAEVMFSPYAYYALKFGEKKTSLANTVDGGAERIVLPRYIDIVWNNGENALIYLEKKRYNTAQALYRYNRKQRSEEIVVFWKRNIRDADILMSPDDTKLILIDKSSTLHGVYLVDINEKTRTRLFEEEHIVNGKLSPSNRYFLYEIESPRDGSRQVRIFDIEENVSKDVPLITDFSKILLGNDDRLIAATAQKWTKKESAEAFPLITLEAVERPELRNPEIKASEIFVRYKPETENTALVYEPSGAQNIHPNRLDLSKDGKYIYFPSVEKIYELKLGK